ncbi:MAG: TetR/AcrR family transcriptional regulator [Acidobacteriota bacterium]
MANTRRTRLTREESRARTLERLLESARDLFGRNGIDATSIEQVAEAAGYSRGAFYSNLDSKDDLVCAVLERELAMIQREMAGILARESPKRLLAAVRDYYVRFATDVDGCMRLVAMQMYALQHPAIRHRIADLFSTDRALKVALVRRAAEELAKLGTPLPASPETLFFVLSSQAQGLCISWMVDPDAIDLARIREALLLSFDNLTAARGGRVGARRRVKTVPPARPRRR